LIQDTYLKCFRASVFTYWEEGYGEVGYGLLAHKSSNEARNYIRSRNDFSKYPFFVLGNEEVSIYQMSLLVPDMYMQIKISGSSPTFVGRNYKINISATSMATNPIAHIRQARNAYIVLTGKSQENRSFGTCVCKGGSIINMDIGLSEMWTELNWLIVGRSSVNTVMHN
jgi:hypothetical protein